MIQSEQDLIQANEALGDLYRALASLRREIEPTNPRGFALLAEGPLHEIRRIQLEIEEFTGARKVAHEGVPLWLKLVGPKALWGETPSSVLTAFLDSLRKGIQGIAGFNVTGRVGGRPPIDLQIACDIEIVSFAPGSFQVGMRLPEPAQVELIPSGHWVQAKDALTEFLAVAEWAASSPTIEDLAAQFQDAAKRRVLLRAVKPFVPRRLGGIDYLELSGQVVPSKRPIHLTQEASERITHAFESAISETEEKFEGEIREMDLDKMTFHLRNVPNVNDVFCRFSDDIAPIASELLGKRVRVIGIRASEMGLTKGALKIVDLEKIEEKPASSK